MSKGRLVVVLLVLALVGAFFVFDLGRFTNLEFVKSQQATVAEYRAQHPVEAALAYFAVYVAVTGLSLPGAAVLTLIGGAVFGLLWGTVLVSFASTAGATVAFLAARYVLRDSVQRRFGDRLAGINAGIERDGAFYLLTLRLVPAIPFFVVNVVMALTPIRTLVFALVSQAGMLAGTVVYVNAGTQLARVDADTSILSPGLVASFTILAIFPLLARRVIDAVKARRALRGWARPRRFERDIVVIGGGSAGLVTSLVGSTVRAKVTLIERAQMGGDCLNTGCVPSKALIRSAKLLAHIGRSAELGIRKASAEFDFAEVMERVQRVVATIEPKDSAERYESLGVECVAGEARITSPYTVEVDGREITTRNVVIATGARPFVPPVPGLEDVGYLTSDTLWDIRELPARLVVLGGGPIGTELTQCFARFGSKVTQVEMLPRILPREDAEVSQFITERLRAEGVDVLVEHRAARFLVEDGTRVLVCEHAGEEVRIPFDQVLVAVGRKANTQGLGLEALGITTTASGTVEVNEYLQTRLPNVFACGDVAGPYQFTHMSAHQAWYAGVNALFGVFRRFRVSYSAVPWATFTEPEVARVGLNELEAEERGIEYEVSTYGLDDLDRAVADEEAHGFVKVLTVPGKDRILGVTIVGEQAGDVIAEYVFAMTHRIGLNKILSTIHIYPTLAEANKYAAGVWKRAHAPERLLEWLGRYHAWRRG